MATRRLVDALRAGAARDRREATLAQDARLFAPAADAPQPGDDTLALLLLCCHRAISPPRTAASRATNVREQRFLSLRAGRLDR